MIISSFCGNCSLPVGDMEVVNSLGGGEEKGSFHESRKEVEKGERGSKTVPSKKRREKLKFSVNLEGS